mmetsp:Transcript_14936/g.28527  ORF Transcript_14936/g.28527 Transcript_14936/m.28527 type:complete len:94 (-) Transcript_14936:110-391(-)|eukprot:scaffold3666_cov160-Amphora_coffeaeformis.AAC.8
MSAEAWGFGSVQRHPDWKNNLRSLSTSPMMVGQDVDLMVGDEPEQIDTNTTPMALGNTLFGMGVLACLVVIAYKRLAKTKKSGTDEHLLHATH